MEADIDLPIIGLSLSLPERLLSNLAIRPCLSGPFVLPDGYEPASPIYSIKSRVEIQRSVAVRIHHYASLQNETDCKEMAFVSASTEPQSIESGSAEYAFKLIENSAVKFRPNSLIGEIELSHFSWFAIVRRIVFGES